MTMDSVEGIVIILMLEFGCVTLLILCSVDRASRYNLCK